MLQKACIFAKTKSNACYGAKGTNPWGTRIAKRQFTGPEVDVYVRFDTDSTTCKELVLPKDMVKYLVNKFTSYVPDKDIQEKVLDANYPVPKKHKD